MLNTIVRLAIAALATGFSAMSIANDDMPQRARAVASGVAFLSGNSSSQPAGESALIATAMLKAGCPAEAPPVSTLIGKVKSRFAAAGYVSEKRSGGALYEAAVSAMALSNLDDSESREQLGMLARYLISKQNPNGSWDYSNRTSGDTSITQYALLGLWECSNAGIEVPPAVWRRSGEWFLSVQSPAGGWSYHPDENGSSPRITNTAAGVGSLLLCARQLDPSRRWGTLVSPLLTPLNVEQPGATYADLLPASRVDQAVKAGLAWMNTNFGSEDPSVVGASIYYGLYGLERVAAFADQRLMGIGSLMQRAEAYVLTNQNAEGSWSWGSDQPAISKQLSTSWAILFLTRSTTKSIQRAAARRLGPGTLVGGRLLPRDLTSMTVAAGRIVSRPMNGAVDTMIAALEDPWAKNADSAIAGLLERSQKEGPDALRPFKARFRRLLTDRQPRLRQAAAWALAHTDDLDVVPDLIAALTDGQDEVVREASLGLQLISRKIDGFGPASPSTPEERRKAASAWSAWYESIRPLPKE